jgi:hypothetical protein
MAHALCELRNRDTSFLAVVFGSVSMWLSVNLWAVLLAAGAAWLLGTAYYTFLAESWVTGLGTSMEHLLREQGANAGTPAAWMPFVVAFVAELLMAGVLDRMLYQCGELDLVGGLTIGFLLWLGLVATTLAVNNTFAGRKLLLTVIDGSHWLLVLLLMGAILGVLG